MKILLLLLASLALPSAADDSLAKLRGIRSEMVAKAIATIDSTYKRDLQKLLDDALKAKHPEEAVAYKDEILRVGVLGNTYRTGTNKGLTFTLMDGGVATYENQGPSGTGKWEIKSGKLSVAVGPWRLELDPQTLKGEMSHQGGKAKPEAVVKN